MARAQKKVVQGARLRDQVYDLIREELKAGEIGVGKRLFEIDLAAKYGVSRTPVREALFQLAREGLLVSKERGYTLPIDTPKDFADRLEVHLLLDPQVARHAALEATSEEIKVLSQALKRTSQAHQAGKLGAFVEGYYQFRITLEGMCRNVPLARCARLIEDQYLAARNEYFKKPENRQITLTYAERVLSAIQARDAAGAERETRAFMQALIEKFVAPQHSALSAVAREARLVGHDSVGKRAVRRRA